MEIFVPLNKCLFTTWPWRHFSVSIHFTLWKKPWHCGGSQVKGISDTFLGIRLLHISFQRLTATSWQFKVTLIYGNKIFIHFHHWITPRRRCMTNLHNCLGTNDQHDKKHEGETNIKADLGLVWTTKLVHAVLLLWKENGLVRFSQAKPK